MCGCAPRKPQGRAVDHRNNRYSFPPAERGCETLRERRARDGVLDKVVPIPTFNQCRCWPEDCCCFPPANRELRCDSGTAPPLCPGVFIKAFRASAHSRGEMKGRLHRAIGSIRLRADGSEKARSHPSLGVRRPTSDMSMLTCAGGKAGTVVSAVLVLDEPGRSAGLQSIRKRSCKHPSGLRRANPRKEKPSYIEALA